MPYKTWAVGEEVIATDFNPNVAQQVVPVFDTAAQRAGVLTAPVVGQLSILKTNIADVYVWTGTAWSYIKPGYRAGHFSGVADAGGITTVTHNLGVVPTAVLVTNTLPNAIASQVKYVVANKAAATFQAVCYRTNDFGAVGSNQCDYDWLVIA